MTIKLLALDLDGTLFADDLVISPRVRKAIRDAQHSGAIVTIATGRMFRAARPIAANLHIAEPLICYQGAMIARSDNGTVLYHETVPRPLALRIIEDVASRNLHLNVYLDDEIYVSSITPEAEYYSRINMDMPLNPVGDLGKWLSAQASEPTKLVIVTDAEQTDATLAIYSGLYGNVTQVTKSHPRFTEFTNIACSKGRALAYLAELCGVRREDVMAIGDGHNDLDMITWAGVGVAMSTAPRAVLDAARIVTGPLSGDGAAEVIERYIIEREEIP